MEIAIGKMMQKAPVWQNLGGWARDNQEEALLCRKAPLVWW